MYLCTDLNLFLHCYSNEIIKPLPDMPILGFSNSAANDVKNMNKWVTII